MTGTAEFVGTMAVTEQLQKMTCGKCGGVYAISERFRQHKHDCGGWWNCPYCKCSWGYSESEADRLKKRLKTEQDNSEYWRKRSRQEAEAHQTTERRRRAEKAAKTKLKKRAAAGVCPCCNRSFQNLRRHMASQHPDFVEGTKGKGGSG